MPFGAVRSSTSIDLTLAHHAELLLDSFPISRTIVSRDSRRGKTSVKS
jgi:hypothetical protein